MTERSLIRLRITFHGFVQGVGFRWHARQAAAMTGCTGWCRNEWDGTVVMEIQGTEEQIDQTVRAIERGRFIEIDRMDIETIPVSGERGFRTE